MVIWFRRFFSSLFSPQLPFFQPDHPSPFHMVFFLLLMFFPRIPSFYPICLLIRAFIFTHFAFLKLFFFFPFSDGKHMRRYEKSYEMQMINFRMRNIICLLILLALTVSLCLRTFISTLYSCVFFDWLPLQVVKDRVVGITDPIFEHLPLISHYMTYSLSRKTAGNPDSEPAVKNLFAGILIVVMTRPPNFNFTIGINSTIEVI